MTYDVVSLVADLHETFGVSLQQARDAIDLVEAGRMPDLVQAVLYFEARRELIRMDPAARDGRDVRRADEMAEDAVRRDPSLVRFREAGPEGGSLSP